MNAFQWTDATSVKQATGQNTTPVADAMLVNAKPESATIFKAGGVDVLDLMKEHVLAPARIVGIGNLPKLDAIRNAGKEGTHLGALVTLAQLERDGDLQKNFRALTEAASHAATPQVRNAATLGGNIMQRPHCWYFRNENFKCLKKGGTVCFANQPGAENKYHAIMGNAVCSAVHGSSISTALVAFGAQVELTGPQGVRRVPLEQFFVTPDKDVKRENAIQANELITDVLLPAPAAVTGSWYIKFGERESYDWALADVAVVLEQQNGRCTKASIVLGAAAPVPLRATAAEAALIGKPINEETARAAGQAATAGATPLEHNAYKVPIFTAIVKRAILKAGEA
ncbi:FAD binding domain-containing protein [Hymenobacter radiodurans]|uniref:FAD binding domain-containing protein n=1 Tax=Hymenobacter radiodurans TaxID=2496028 RepID=UPI0010585B99|nr:FAD binding domain-containing protein [Hymenobacter radiodurans]